MSDEQPAILRTPDNRRPIIDEHSPPRLVRHRKKAHRPPISDQIIRSVARRLNFDELEEDWINFPLKFKKIKKANASEGTSIPKSILFLR